MENKEIEQNPDQVVTEAVEPKPATLTVGVQFKTAGKIYTFLTNDPTLERDQPVQVEADDGTSVGFVIAPPEEAIKENIPKNAKWVMHRATEKELSDSVERKEKAIEYFEACRERISEHNLDMKLIDAEIVEGGKKVVFFFFAEQRVDFRSLVKDLAGALHMRIEMRQIGARDESKLIGCIGPCGLKTCCSSHLRQFKSISISMAKQQGLTPNPAKLTGMCGKLKCCLSYEHEAYQELRKGLPKLGAAVESPKGAGKIIDLNILKRDCAVLLYGGPVVRCSCKECKLLNREERDSAIAASRKPDEPKEERPRRGRRTKNNTRSRGRKDDKKS
ncbi:MAG: stage 0 sporulation protein [Deltaproteobacteria bacterium]|jgi:cell fate regulator YaaT (PSP1 superfamily)|nr:stage 0 sporulation protein [Deltaproteobacteria bacterium]